MKNELTIFVLVKRTGGILVFLPLLLHIIYILPDTQSYLFPTIDYTISFAFRHNGSTTDCERYSA
ncbi:hypothetical protein BDV30DRAFT_213652 [Aspergillus minisclerotigenes]|uniref:Uncharacterized protein n=1 Tax=Aspergillus minisclerotigenes TaxID=656917 RepID=A0A5N6IZK8_9EURO|nr:hypothetical protein BDV30DRAFT_213652 [Aspergillus minisclerotigenes]